MNGFKIIILICICFLWFVSLSLIAIGIADKDLGSCLLGTMVGYGAFIRSKEFIKRSKNY